MAGRRGEDYLQLFVEEGDWYDRIVLGTLLPGWAWESLPRPVRAWLRNYIGGVLLYFGSSFLWCFYIYYWKRNVYLPKGFAFHPLDGILQALPHTIALFLVPTHLMTHMLLLFCEGVWMANIHDCIHGEVWPIMGAGYHTIHHITYHHNYGHYTIWMDWMFGTLCCPEEDVKKAS